MWLFGGSRRPCGVSLAAPLPLWRCSGPSIGGLPLCWVLQTTVHPRWRFMAEYVSSQAPLPREKPSPSKRRAADLRYKLDHPSCIEYRLLRTHVFQVYTCGSATPSRLHAPALVPWDFRPAIWAVLRGTRVLTLTRRYSASRSPGLGLSADTPLGLPPRLPNGVTSKLPASRAATNANEATLQRGPIQRAPAGSNQAGAPATAMQRAYRSGLRYQVIPLHVPGLRHHADPLYATSIRVRGSTGTDTDGHKHHTSRSGATQSAGPVAVWRLVLRFPPPWWRVWRSPGAQRGRGCKSAGFRQHMLQALFCLKH